jgi:hypothetical protein
MTIEFLLQRASKGDKLALDVALHCLDAMSRGGCQRQLDFPISDN